MSLPGLTRQSRKTKVLCGCEMDPRGEAGDDNKINGNDEEKKDNELMQKSLIKLKHIIIFLLLAAVIPWFVTEAVFASFYVGR